MNIEVISAGKRHTLHAESGSNLMECLNRAGLMEGSECGGRGVCGKCAVKVLSGEFTPAKEGEDISRLCGKGEVLACRCLIRGEAVIELGSGRDDVQRKLHMPKLADEADLNHPPVSKIVIEMDAPTLQDQLSDLERVLAKLPKGTRFAPGVLASLPSTLRGANFAVTCVLIGDELAAVESGDTLAEKYGFVIDIGTTTVAVYLVDMTTGKAIDAEGIANPQRVYGADVISRITAAGQPGGLEKLQRLMLEGLSEAMDKMLVRSGRSAQHIYTAVVVGNTTMSHLFLGVDPANLALAPFIPCYRPSVTLKGKSLGLPMLPEGYVHVLANISGYVGSDTLGVIMATRLWEQEGVSLAVDIGTNGEIILGSKDWILACSAAAGPAFEGAHIEQGMRAGEGAVEKVSLEDDTVTLGVIGKAAPQGLCGSGLIDAVAELIRTGLITKTGSFITDKDKGFSQPLASRLRVTASNIREFVLAWQGEYGNTRDIVITQKDIRELQLAKAAIAAGIEILLNEVQIKASQVDRLYLAGAFGNYLDRNNAVVLGLFPGIPVDKIIPVGNAAAKGAGLCLLSAEHRNTSDRIAKLVKPVELSAHPDFNTFWIRALNFPKIAPQANEGGV